jgi:hypothetical protein
MSATALIGTLAGVAGSVGTSIYNQYNNNQINKDNQAFAMQMYNKQRQDALDDWYRQNDISAQLQRYKSAGLSPHLIYGQANQTPSIRSTPMATPMKERVNIENPLQQGMLGFQMASANLQNKLLEKEINSKEIANKSAEISLSLQAKYSEIDRMADVAIKQNSVAMLKTSNEGLELANQNIKASTEVLQQNKISIEASTDGKLLLNVSQKVQNQYQEAKIKLDMQQANLSMTKDKKQIQVYEQQIKESKARILKMQQDTEQIKTIIDLNKQQFDYNSKNQPFQLMAQHRELLMKMGLTDAQIKSLETNSFERTQDRADRKEQNSINNTRNFYKDVTDIFKNTN